MKLIEDMMFKKDIIMISQPTYNKSNEQIKEERAEVIKKLIKKGYFIKDTIVNDINNIKNNSIYHLSKSLEIMSYCNAVCFMKDWENNKECKIEHEVAKAYNLKIIYSEDII